jgi:hypothetical protein
LDFPNLWRYQAILAERDSGMLLVFLLLLIVLGIVVNTRWMAPGQLGKVRAGLLIAYFVSLVLMVGLRI